RPAGEERGTCQPEDEGAEREERELEQPGRLVQVEVGVDRLEQSRDLRQLVDQLAERRGRRDDEQRIEPDIEAPRDRERRAVRELPREWTTDAGREGGQSQPVDVRHRADVAKAEGDGPQRE